MEYRKAVAAGALSGKVKELMALAIGAATHCDGCMAYHGHEAVQAGANRRGCSRRSVWRS